MTNTRRAILERLADGPRSGEALADDLDVSRAAIWKQVEALREQDFVIESDDEGYALVDVPEYGGDAIQFGLDAPFTIEFHEETGSTNDLARERAADGAEDLVIVAEEQTGGRGRLDREWASPSGGIWLSILVRPDRPPATIPLFTLAAAVAITTAVRESGVDAGIKWPNDVLVSERQRANDGSSGEQSESDGVPVSPDPDGEEAKLAGVLTEMEGEADRVEWLVVGMGINANLDADRLPDGSTSLRTELGEDVNRRLFVQRVLETFDDLRNDPDRILERWRADALTLGREVRVETASGDTVVGTAVDVEHPGTLLVETEDGVERIHAGDCEHLRPT
ncbi:biotin--acetyl-CoA-carboxylase ligase [Salinarchaeum sp. Harcht-Bsk1]|uniref:bifunctional biotin--[acetyl-CoA-carboxylase] synthetase/biotin operon repressor n=1 Tax=Salinarchaeum sp. Harcht-Bsk1 TaxID=1333523 RepID=UPI0003422E58|nr:bifunctional biotin--[acetyl-CoA-carboxylase] synthetase/biotin operon repressor [Salinarchaeum sp. Harcht-Bsk1]AGN02634.1 biotin--acetyl-CoA-carboxylase ligase [Salinarchaeum sp. Harcht-Bsk1]